MLRDSRNVCYPRQRFTLMPRTNCHSDLADAGPGGVGSAASRVEKNTREHLRKHLLLQDPRKTTLIDDLLSRARADSGRDGLNLQPIDLRGTLQDFDGLAGVAGSFVPSVHR